MPRRRYLPPNEASTLDEALPLDTQLTILTRQSTFKQAVHNLYSQERNPSELVHEAQRMGFASVKVYDWDTGIGAYSTTIEDRPGLRHWLNDLLPNGVSRVPMVSQEDRLFRDRWETQHNEFIRRVALHGGWVICGQRIYNFRREMDCEQFRLACKYGKQYIEHHIKGRLHPANHRNALSGRYAGGAVPWGYIVDGDRHSATYKRFMRYEPHATLVIHQVFERFAAMTRPSVMELTRLWEREGRTWPFFGPEVDERRKRVLGQALARSDGASGYRFHYRQAQHILTSVAYLGWCVHRGEVAWDAERAVPSSATNRSSAPIFSGGATISSPANAPPGRHRVRRRTAPITAHITLDALLPKRCGFSCLVASAMSPTAVATRPRKNPLGMSAWSVHRMSGRRVKQPISAPSSPYLR